jgi:GNAT superfamily N-acetyltransferase
MLYTEPAFRGRGIGKRLVEEAVRFSRASGYRRIILWTQDCLTSARRIYQSAGFQLVREEKHHSFGADLNGQYWALELQGS